MVDQVTTGPSETARVEAHPGRAWPCTGFLSRFISSRCGNPPHVSRQSEVAGELLLRRCPPDAPADTLGAAGLVVRAARVVDDDERGAGDLEPVRHRRPSHPWRAHRLDPSARAPARPR